MKSTFIEHRACLSDTCGSSDGMGVYEKSGGELYGYCFACSTFFPDIDGVKEKAVVATVRSVMPTTNVLDDVTCYKSLSDPSRGLYDWAMAHFNVKVEVSEADGTTPTAHYYPYTNTEGKVVAYKKRGLPKTFATLGEWKDLELFGQRQAMAAGGKRLICVEGEADCVALYQALKVHNQGTQWDTMNYAVVSGCNGAQSIVRDLTRNANFVRRFEQIVLAFDQDEAGKKAVVDVLKLYPTALIASFDEKDANEMVKKGKVAALVKAVLFNAQRNRPEHIAPASALVNKAQQKPTVGLPFPWPTLTATTYGLQPKRIYTVGAGVGMGKTELAKEIIHSLLYNHDQKVGAFLLEEDSGQTVRSIAGKHDNMLYHDPTLEFDPACIATTIAPVQDNLFLYTNNYDRSWDEVKVAIRYLVAVEEVKWVFLDNLTVMVAHLSVSAQNEELSRIMVELSSMIAELDFSIFVFSHLNTPQVGPPHELGGEALESQLTGSRAMMKFSDYIIMLEGNKSPDLPPAKRNHRLLKLRKDRAFGRAITIGLNYNPVTGRLLEPSLSNAY